MSDSRGPSAVSPPVVLATGLSTGAVARGLGISPMTLRSWDRRYGIGPAAREGGRHRRWTPQNIAVLERMCRLTSSGVPPAEAARAALAGADAAEPVRAAEREATQPRTDQPLGTDQPPRTDQPPGGDTPPSEDRPPRRGPGSRTGLPLGNVRQECRGLARAAVRLDADSIDELLAAAIAEHGLVTAWDSVIMPALRAVGRKWETSGERYIEVEHLMSWHISTALRRLAASPAGRPARVAPALLACVPGEMHTLPLEALAAGLGERGVLVRMFGAAVPAEALEEAVRRTGPAAVVLWAQSRATASRPLAQQIGSIGWGVRGARTRPAMIVAGPGWSGLHLPGTVRPRGLEEAINTVADLCVP
ncbi:B12-binding domain-containing protein [Streptomyces sp. 21So2-11]|uniref:B12-binding domain-containing protein n=1 Tax=Streptomyces sp. 21So2-11 TaxID=3144408 RepID=UPI00321BCA20